MRKILLIAPNWVGDSVHMLPAVAAIRRAYPDAELVLAARAPLCELHAANPLFDRQLPLPPRGSRLRTWGLFLSLRRERFDTAVVFPQSFSAGLAAFLSGARHRLGRSTDGRRLLLTGTGRLGRRDRRRHVTEEYLDLARLTGAPVDPDADPPVLPLTPAGIDEQRRVFEDAGLRPDVPVIALCPTSSYGPARRWPDVHWVTLARRLTARRCQPVVVAAPSERKGLEELLGGTGPGVACVTPGLQGLAACLASSRVVVAGDSGPLHVASAVGTPTVGLYGPTNPEWTAPGTARARTFYLRLDCSPCHARVCPYGHRRCLLDIAPDDVLSAVTALLADPRPGGHGGG